jgi:hypothetical protein
MFNPNRWFPGTPRPGYPGFLNGLYNYGRNFWQQDVVHPFERYVVHPLENGYGQVRQGIRHTGQAASQDYARLKRLANQQYRHVRNVFSNDYHQGRRIIGNEVAGAHRRLNQGLAAGERAVRQTPGYVNKHIVQPVESDIRQAPGYINRNIQDPYAGYPMAKPNRWERDNEFMDNLFNVPYNFLQQDADYYARALHDNRNHEVHWGVTPATIANKTLYGIGKAVTGWAPGMRKISDDLPTQLVDTDMDDLMSGLLFPTVIANNIYRGYHHGQSPAALNGLAQAGANYSRAGKDHMNWVRPPGYNPGLFDHHQSSVRQDVTDIINPYLGLFSGNQWAEDYVGNLVTLASLDDPAIRGFGRLEGAIGESATKASDAGHPTMAAGLRGIQKGAGHFKEGLVKYNKGKEKATIEFYKTLFGGSHEAPASKASITPPDKYAIAEAGQRGNGYHLIDLTTHTVIKNPKNKSGLFDSRDQASQMIGYLRSRGTKPHASTGRINRPRPSASSHLAQRVGNPFAPPTPPLQGLENLMRMSPEERQRALQQFVQSEMNYWF